MSGLTAEVPCAPGLMVCPRRPVDCLRPYRVKIAPARPVLTGVLVATLLAPIANGSCTAAKAVDGGTDAAAFIPDCDPLPKGADSGCQAPDGGLSANGLQYPFGCEASFPVEGTPHTCTCRPGPTDASTWAWWCGV